MGAALPRRRYGGKTAATLTYRTVTADRGVTSHVYACTVTNPRGAVVSPTFTLVVT